MSERWRDRPHSERALTALLAVLGVRAVAGGAALVLDPSGSAVGLDPTALAGSPFGNYLVPGLVLLVVLGVGSLAVAVATYGGRAWARSAAIAVAAALLVWVVVEGTIVGFGERLQPLNAAWAVAVAALALWAPSDGDD